MTDENLKPEPEPDPHVTALDDLQQELIRLKMIERAATNVLSAFKWYDAITLKRKVTDLENLIWPQ